MSDWLSGAASGPKPQASLYGKDIDPNTIARTQTMRVLASRYMELAQQYAQSNFYRRLFNQLSEYDNSFQQWLRTLQQVEATAGQFGEQYYIRSLQYLLAELLKVRAAIDAGSSSKKNDHIALVDTMRSLLDQKIARFLQIARNPRESYFGGQLEGVDETLDFLIWKHKADQLEVNYTQQDIAEILASETLRELTPEATSDINNYLTQQFRGFYNTDILTQALTDEFRVRAAKASVAGITSDVRVHTFTTPPILTTPDELYEWFLDNRTTVRVALVELPVAKFVDQVPDPASDAPLRELYTKHKNDEFNPALERPGFKEPRKVKVEWMAIPEESEFYRKIANIALALDPLATAVRFAEEYESYKNNAPRWTDPLAFGYRTGVHDSSVASPEAVATLAAIAGGTGPLGGALAFEGAAIAKEIRDRAIIGSSAILAAAMQPAPLSIDALPLVVTPPDLSQKQLAATLQSRLQNKVATDLMRQDLAKFGAELAKFSQDADGGKAANYINEFVTARQFRRGGMAEARDRYSLPTDPSLETIRKGFDRTVARGQDDPVGEFFASYLMDSFGPGKPTNYQVKNLTSGDTTYMLWRVEDREPKVHPFDQVRPQVLAAWKRIQARELARAEAEKLATQAKGMDAQKLRDLAAQVSPRPLIELSEMAMKNRQMTPTAGPAQYEPPTISRSRIAYPGDNISELTTKVMDLRKQEPGATTVVFDQPKSNYYVVSLIGKQVPTMSEFRTAYLNSMGPEFMRDRLFDYYRAERYEAFREGLIKQMREDAKVVVYDRKDDREVAQ
jgi:hypothetical protein